MMRKWASLIAVVLVGLLTAASSQAQQPAVVGPKAWPTQIVARDLNGDGKADLVVMSNPAHGFYRVNCLLNQAGSFADTKAGIGEVDQPAGSMAVAKVDAAGHIAVLWPGTYSTTVGTAQLAGINPLAPSSLTGNGFTYAGSNPAKFSQTLAADLNGDGLDDVVVLDSANDELYIFVNDGTASGNGNAAGYRLASQIPLGTGGSGHVAVGDFNGDGHPDIVVNSATNHTVATYWGNGTGTFAAGQVLTLPDGIYSMAPGDMDRDGRLDLVVETRGGALSYFSGTPAGFSAGSQSILGAQDGASGRGGRLVAVADLNGDGLPDILTATPAGLSVLLAIQNSAVTSSPLLLLKGIYNIGPGRASFALADLNGDGKVDLAVDSPEGVAILYGNGDGSFQTSRAYAAGVPAEGLALGAFTAPGQVDALISYRNPVLMQPDGAGGFVASTTAFPHQPMGYTGLPSMAVGDFSGDGHLDAYFPWTAWPVNGGTGSILPGPDPLDTGDGAGHFTATAMYNFASAYNPLVADFDGDGRVDLLTPRLGCAIYYGDDLATAFYLGFHLSDTYYSVSAAGFLRAGRTTQQDVVCGNATGFDVYRNDGHRSFTHTSFIPYAPGYALDDVYGAFPATGLFPASVLLTDIDGDGNGDLVVLYHNLAADVAHPNAATSNQLYVYWGNGDGTFNATPSVTTLTRNFYEVSVADVDGDGKADLLLHDGYVLGVLPGKGAARGFGAEKHWLAGMGINGVATTTVNGATEIVVANGGAALANPLVHRGSLAANAEVDTGGLTVLSGVTPAAATLTGILTADPPSPGYGRTFTLTATLAYGTGPEPTGYVTFSVDGSVVGTGTLAAGVASFTVTLPSYAVGTHPVSAQFAGDANYASVTLTGSVTVTLLPTDTYMTDVVTPIHYGEIIGDIAKGYAEPSNPMAGDTQLLDGGNLDFLIDGKLVCTLPYITGVSQVCPATTGAGYNVGAYQLSSQYTGNAYYASSSSPNYQVVVLPDDTTGAVTSSLNPSAVGQAVTFTATFSSPYAVPNGLVTFYDGAVKLGTATLNAGGAGTLITSALALGSHNITATYAGNGNFNGSTTPVLVQVVQAPPVATTMTIASSANPSIVGTNVTFSVVVTGATTTVSQPSGPVTFTIDGVTAATVNMTNGTASYATSTLAVGSHTVAASYAGGTTTAGDMFTGSSASLVQQVSPVPAAPDFTLTVTPAVLSVPIGNNGIAAVTVTGLNGFVANVALSCGDLPRGVTCTFIPSTVKGGSGGATLLVHATAPHACGSDQEFFHAAGPPSWLGMAGVTALFVALRRKRALLRGGISALVLAGMFLAGGCSQCTDLGVKPGNYSFTVTGTVSEIAVATPGGPTSHTVTVKMVARL